MLAALALWLRLLMLRLRSPGPAARAATTLARSDGPLIWLRVGADAGADAGPGAALLLRRLRRARPTLALIASLPAGNTSPLDGIETVETPEDTPASATLVLDAWRPAMIVLLGNEMPPALIATAEARGIPVMLVDVRAAPRSGKSGLFAWLLQRACLERIARISARDPDALAAMTRLGAAPGRIEVGGVLAEPAEPLRCSEAERASIAAVLLTRPVWLAAAVPEAERAPVLEAHAIAQRHAHRMLLILAPDTGEGGEALAEQLEADGWSVALRTREGEPDEMTNIFIADDPGEYGLWYRIAPVTYMGGTLSGGAGRARSPLEPAALGSAIVHGHQTAPFAAEYSRLDDARATRSVFDAHSLGEALADLMAPDRAAVLAHNAWVVTSSGAGAAEALARSILTELDSRILGQEAA